MAKTRSLEKTDERIRVLVLRIRRDANELTELMDWRRRALRGQVKVATKAGKAVRIRASIRPRDKAERLTPPEFNDRIGL